MTCCAIACAPLVFVLVTTCIGFRNAAVVACRCLLSFLRTFRVRLTCLPRYDLCLWYDLRSRSNWVYDKILLELRAPCATSWRELLWTHQRGRATKCSDHTPVVSVLVASLNSGAVGACENA